MKIHIIVVIFLIVFIPLSKAQHGEEVAHDQNNEHDGVIHKVTLVMANSFLKNQVDESTNNVLVVPTFGLNYDVLFHHKWGVGFHSDIVLQQYKVENHDNHEVLVRENPVALCVVGQYKPITPLTIIAGYGIELEKHENIQLFRLGLEYGFHLPKNWELGIALEYDWKFSTYSSWVFGVGFSKLFMKKT